MAEAGRNTILTEELVRKIKQSILDGNDLKTTANVCGINESTLYAWSSDNYLNLADKIEGWKRDRKLLLADRNIDSILSLGISDRNVIKVVADMSKFVKETLDRDNYKKKTETDLTSKGEKILGINYITPNGTDDKSDNQTTSSISGTE